MWLLLQELIGQPVNDKKHKVTERTSLKANTRWAISRYRNTILWRPIKLKKVEEIWHTFVIAQYKEPMSTKFYLKHNVFLFYLAVQALERTAQPQPFLLCWKKGEKNFQKILYFWLVTEKRKEAVENNKNSSIATSVVDYSTCDFCNNAWFSYVGKIQDGRQFHCFPTMPDFP